jgi:hypothetical protein
MALPNDPSKFYRFYLHKRRIELSKPEEREHKIIWYKDLHVHDILMFCKLTSKLFPHKTQDQAALTWILKT